jgi:arginase
MILDRIVSLIGAPLDLGGVHRGSSLGPAALRLGGLATRLERLGLAVHDRGDVPVPRVVRPTVEDVQAKNLEAIIGHCTALRDEVRAALAARHFPLVVGGDHAIACGTIAGVAQHHREAGKKLGLVWFDAHGDMNTPDSSPSGNVHGMPLATCLGRGPRALVELAGAVPMLDVEHCVLVGIHDLDPGERALIREIGLRIYTMREIDMLGMQRVAEEALSIANDGTDGFHLSFDVDGCDLSIAPGTGTTVPGGATWRESHLLMENAADSGRLASLEIVEVNPLLDVRNTTAELAIGLIESALGKLTI